MDLINSWRSKNKQWDKYALKIRIGKFTLFDLYYDHAKKQFGIILFNLGARTSPPKKYEGNENHKRFSDEDRRVF